MKKIHAVIGSKWRPSIRVLLLLMASFVYTSTSQAQDQEASTPAYISETIASLDTLLSDIQKVKHLTTTAGQKRYTPPTRILIDKAFEIAHKENNPKLLANAHYSLGNFYYYASKIDSSLIYLDKALSYTEKTNDPLLKSSVLATKGGAYSKLGAVILAISTNIEAQQIIDQVDTLLISEEEKLKYKGQQLVLNNSLANLYNKTEDYDKALKFYNYALVAAKNVGSKPNEAILLNNKGNLLIKMEQFEEGLATLQQGKKLKIESKLPPRFIAGSDLNIGITQFAVGKKEQALHSYNKALDIYQTANYELGILQTLSERGILYNASGKHEMAKQDCLISKELALKINDSEYLIKSCDCLYAAFNALGNFKESLVNHELYTRVKDSVFNEKNIRKITQVGMQYEFDKKEAEQLLIIEEKNRQKNQILAGLIALGVFAITLLVFFRKRLKYQKTIGAQKLELQQKEITSLQQENKLTAMNSMIEGQEAERLRIAKDLHDSLGGLLSTVKAHFTTIQQRREGLSEVPLTQKTNKLIDEACIEVRRISHNMMPHALSLSGLEGTVQDITDNLIDQGYKANFEVNNLPKMEATKEVMVYRLLQEIISNVRKHAQARNILIQLFGHDNELNITVEDDGKGFDFQKALNNGGLGLRNINSRVAFLDGNIDWDTQTDQGTTVNISIPI